jgi:Glutamate formiminotransferase
MSKLIECVPNFSEGRDKEKLEKILDEIRATEGVKLLDYSMDKDHNRSVVTFIGEPEKVIEAAFRAAKKASELIDMRTHKGEHPRMGATDVIPLIPISDVTMDECIELSKKLAERIGNELSIPVYLYEKISICSSQRKFSRY